MIDLHIPIKVKLANTFWKRFIGLMFKKEMGEEGLYLTPCNSIHMFFVRFPIDVVMLDRAQRVIRIFPNLKPWKVILPVSEAYSTVELPVGSIDTYNIKEGSVLHITF